MVSRKVSKKVFTACWYNKSVERRQRRFKGKYKIGKGSVHEQLIADCMEDGQGYKNTTFIVNTMRSKEGMSPIGLSAVRESYLCLQPEKIRIKTVPTGNFCAHSNWAKATFNWSKQLAVAFDVLDPRQVPDPPMPPPLDKNARDDEEESDNESILRPNDDGDVVANDDGAADKCDAADNWCMMDDDVADF